MRRASFRPMPAPRRGVSTEGLLVMRGRWRDLAELVRRSARICLDQPLERLDEAQLANHLNRTGAADLPVDGDSAKRIRIVFVEACRAMLQATGERRAIAAELAAAAAVAVLELLDLETRAAAAGWQKQFRD